MSQSVSNKYKVYRDTDEISLKDITLGSEKGGNPCLKVSVSIDGTTIENVTFKRDIASKGYAISPSLYQNPSSGVTILFGGMVQEILDNFADYILPLMKPLGINTLIGEKILDPMDRIKAREIIVTQRKINEHQSTWQK